MSFYNCTLATRPIYKYLPDIYRALTYISNETSDPNITSKARLNLPIVSTDDLEYDIDVTILNVRPSNCSSDSQYRFIFGSRDVRDYTNETYFAVFDDPEYDARRFVTMSANTGSIHSKDELALDGNRYRVQHTDTMDLFVNGIGAVKTKYESPRIESEINIGLFSIHNGYSSYEQTRTIFKCHKFRISSKKQGVDLDLVPALRRSDNKPGLYDINSGRFFVSDGSDEFSYSL